MIKVFATGNLTADPELRTTPNGISVCTFKIASNRRFKDANGEQITEFMPVVAWRQLGEMCGKYLSKGKKVCVIGEIQTRQYDAKDGTKRSVTEIVADEVEFLSPRENASQKGAQGAEQGFEGFTELDDSSELPF
jgi:single-strand DNA-binding protein